MIHGGKTKYLSKHKYVWRRGRGHALVAELNIYPIGTGTVVAQVAERKNQFLKMASKVQLLTHTLITRG